MRAAFFDFGNQCEVRDYATGVIAGGKFVAGLLFVESVRIR
jgi:hypothetical protein